MTTFSEELKNCKSPKSLVLGNGFGLSYDKATNGSKFNWKTLLDLCDIESDSPIYGLLEQCNFDFELAHQKLNVAVYVVDRYEPTSELIQKFKDQIQYLRDQLVIAVTNSHPDSFNSKCSPNEEKARDMRVRTCRTFLDQFDTVFSLNYDLLLYWVRCYKNDFHGRDSFNKENSDLIFSPDDSKKNPHFLFPHGALFIYRDRFSATKSGSSKSNPILARVASNIREGNFPMCISEGKGCQKLEAIKNNKYLLFAYDQIKQCEGTIFTFSCSFQDQKDDHIIEAMLKSPAKKIVVGQFKPDDVAYHRINLEFERIKVKTKLKKVITVADTSDTKLW